MITGTKFRARSVGAVVLAGIGSLALLASTALAKTPNDPMLEQGLLWGLQNPVHPGTDIHAESAWNITAGSSQVAVMMIDPGVDYTHPDLAANIWNNPRGLGGCPVGTRGYNTIAHTCDPMDDTTAGVSTHEAGIIGAVGNNGFGSTGVDWTITIIPCKAFDAEGNGTIQSVIDCLQLARTLKQQGVNIVATQNDWSTNGYNDQLRQELDAQMAANILFVSKAGNISVDQDNSYSRMWPQDNEVDNVITVAATDSTDNLWSWSATGSSMVSLGAPGVGIDSTARGGGYQVMDGTEQSSAFVSGVAALLAAQDPTRDWRAIKNLILSGGDNDPALNNILHQTISGKRLNAYGSMTCQNSPVVHRLRPAGDGWTAVNIPVGTLVELSALNINCGAAAGPVTVMEEPGNIAIPLTDAATSPDHAPASGVYHNVVRAAYLGNYTFKYPDGSQWQANVIPAYSYQPQPLNWVNFAGTNLELAPNSDKVVTLPFPIDLGGVTHTSVDVDSNGRLSFGVTGSDANNVSLPNPAQEYVDNVDPFWDKLSVFPNTNQEVWTGVAGSAPNRQFVVEWYDVSRAGGCNDPNATVTFQAVFYENSPNFEFNYGNTTFGGPAACAIGDHGGQAFVGEQMMFPSAVQVSFDRPSIMDNTSYLFTRIPDAPPATAIAALRQGQAAMQTVASDSAAQRAASDAKAHTTGTNAPAKATAR